LALIPLVRKIDGINTREIKQEWDKSQIHTREWHYLQSKILRHRVCGSFFLYVAQLSHLYTLWDLDSHFDTQQIYLFFLFIFFSDFFFINEGKNSNHNYFRLFKKIKKCECNLLNCYFLFICLFFSVYRILTNYNCLTKKSIILNRDENEVEHV